jgi:metal-dependent amidase/aminoacylase/carboxypeptidase family protein
MNKTLGALEHAQALQDRIVAVRWKIHENPELSFRETATANLAARELEEAGYGAILAESILRLMS